MISRKTRSEKGELLLSDESGIIIPIVIVSIVTLLIFFSFVARTGYRNVVRSEMQAAADAAAHAGAQAMCNSQACFNDAKAKVIAKLAESPIHKGMDGKATLDLRAVAGAGPVWNVLDDYEVTILRGAWWPKGVPFQDQIALASEPRFMVLETNPDLSAIGGAQTSSGLVQSWTLPTYSQANGVYVRISLKDVKNPLSFLSSELPQVTVESVGVAGSHGAAQIAPFAIPLCSLMNSRNKFDVGYLPPLTPPAIQESNRCNNDFYFTRADRYCPSRNPNCIRGVVPDFAAYPVDIFTADDVIPFTSFPFLGVPAGEFPQYAGTLNGGATYDRFGFVGSPGNQLSENEIVDILANNGGLPANIGDSFYVLQNGLTPASAAAALLSNRLNGYDPAEAALDPANYTPRPKDYQAAVPLSPTFSAGEGAWSTYTSSQSLGGFGVCNSQYFDLNNNRNDAAAFSTPAATCAGWVGPAKKLGEPTSYYPRMWNTKAAVVIWENMGSCESDGNPLDTVVTDPIPPINPKLTIIGFIDIRVYDFDIAPPPPPITQLYNLNSAVNGQPAVFDCSGGAGSSGNFPATHPNWWFTPPDFTQPISCNVVRARVSCDAAVAVLPSTAGSPARPTFLAK